MGLKAHALVTRTYCSGRFAICLKSCRYYQATECRGRHLALLLRVSGEPGSQLSPAPLCRVAAFLHYGMFP